MHMQVQDGVQTLPALRLARAHRCSLKFSAVREEQKDKYSPEEREACVAVICAISNDGRMRRQRKGKEIGCWPSAT